LCDRLSSFTLGQAVLVQCPQVLPESAGEELKMKILKHKNIILESGKIFIYMYNMLTYAKNI
jgi:hypothetical protein